MIKYRFELFSVSHRFSDTKIGPTITRIQSFEEVEKNNGYYVHVVCDITLLGIKLCSVTGKSYYLSNDKYTVPIWFNKETKEVIAFFNGFIDHAFIFRFGRYVDPTCP